jgi:hypothetical protein
MGEVPRVTAFRNFANQLFSSALEQLCTEFEREVSTLSNDVQMYRSELNRCAELLGHQLGRERQLHSMLEKVADHQTSIASSAQRLVQQQSSLPPQHLHELVDRVHQQYGEMMNEAIGGVHQAHSLTNQHLETARQMHEPLVSAENEFARICQLLQVPTISERSPTPTASRTDRSAAGFGNQFTSQALAAPMASAVANGMDMKRDVFQDVLQRSQKATPAFASGLATPPPFRSPRAPQPSLLQAPVPSYTPYAATSIASIASTSFPASTPPKHADALRGNPYGGGFPWGSPES